MITCCSDTILYTLLVYLGSLIIIGYVCNKKCGFKFQLNMNEMLSKNEQHVSRYISKYRFVPGDMI